jgi:hypothetical protein
MSGQSTSVFGTYRTATQAELAVERLIQADFTDDAISLLLPSNRTSSGLDDGRARGTAEKRATGITAGGVIGGSLGVLAGLCALAIRGSGPRIAARRMIGALADVGLNGAVGGVLLRAFIGMGIPESGVKHHQSDVNQDGVLLFAHCDLSEQITKAKAILKSTGAQDISLVDEV